MTTLSARSHPISGRVMRPLDLDARLAARERIRRMCDTAHRMSRMALGIGFTSE